MRGVGGNSAGLGVTQGDAIRNITGTALIRTTEIGTTGVFTSYAYSSYGISAPHGTGMMLQFDASRVVPTADENRPANVAVRYFIRAKNS